MAIDYAQIGRNVKHYRLQKELKQIQLAEKVHVTEQHISHIECGRTKLSLPLLVSLSEALSVDVRLLLGMKDRTPELDAELSEVHYGEDCFDCTRSRRDHADQPHCNVQAYP